MSDAAVFDCEAFLDHTGRDYQFAKAVIEESLIVMPEYIDEVRSAVQSQNSENTRRAAHKIKGGMRTIYAHAAGDIAEEIEKAAVSHDPASYKDLMLQLERAYRETISALEKFLSESQ